MECGPGGGSAAGGGPEREGHRVPRVKGEGPEQLMATLRESGYLKTITWGNIPRGPEVKILPSSLGGVGWILGWGTKVPMCC